MTVPATQQAQQVYVEITIESLTDHIRQGAEFSAAKCIKGIPADARFFRAIPTKFDSIVLIFEHESFDEVRVGSPIPLFELEFEEI